MACDGYINVENVKLTVNVVSPFQVNGDLVSGDSEHNPAISLKTGEEASLVIDSLPYAYQAMWGTGFMPSQVTNFYGKNGSLYLRNEEKTHADGTTIAIEEAEEKHELNYTLDGELPEGLTFEVLTGTAYGLRTNKPIEVVTGLKISGTPAAAGTYTVTVTENVPVCMALAGIWLMPQYEMPVSQSFDIVVE